MTTITQTKQRTLALHLQKPRTRTTLSRSIQKKTKQKKKQRFILSWKGFEKQREEIRQAALRYREADTKLAELCDRNGWSTIGMTVRGKRRPDTTNIKEAKEAGEALKKIEELQSQLVQEHNLDFDLVRREWATILDPSEKERKLCDNLVIQQESIQMSEDFDFLDLNNEKGKS